MDKILSYSSNPELWFRSLGLTILIILLIVTIGYFLPKKEYKVIFTKFIGVLLFIRFSFLHGYEVGLNHWNIFNSLPLHLCGISSIVCIIIMFNYNQSLFEYIVLLGIPSAIHSILTPQFIHGWDGYYFYDFYFTHGAILLVPLYLTVVFGHKIRRDSWKTAFINGLILAAIIGIVNIIIGVFYGIFSNYMYLCTAPIADNPLLLTSQWPYYIPMIIFFMFIHVMIVFYIYKLIGKVSK